MIDISTLNAAQITVLGSAFCAMLSMHFTSQLLSQHLFYWKNPKEQKAIIIIILMAPIYAAVSFVGLLGDFVWSFLNLNYEIQGIIVDNVTP